MPVAKKVMLLGDIGVGKTSIVRRLVFDSFDTNYKATLGVDIYRHVLAGTGASDDTELVIWDIDGDLADSIFNHIYIRGAAGALIICDSVRPETRESMLRLAQGFSDALPGRPFALVSNKQDLLDAESTGSDALPDWLPETLHFRTSAKTGTAVEAAFAGLAKAMSRIGL